MRLRTLCLAFSFFAPALSCPAQVFDLDKDREPVVSLDGLWRFHPGDDLRWADPAFDDSQWPLIHGDRGWSGQGYKNMAGSAWYRAKILVPAGVGPLAIYVPIIGTSYQLFADGQLIGGRGGMPPHEHAYYYPHSVYLLPGFDRPHVISIAFRVWHWALWATYFPGGLRKGTLIGKRDLIQDWGALKYRDAAWRYVLSDSVLGVLETLTGLAALALFVLRRREREYLWFAMAMLLQTASTSFHDSFHFFHSVGVVEFYILLSLLQAGAALASVAFYFKLLRGKPNWLFSLSVGSILVNGAFGVTFSLTSGISVPAANILGGILGLPTVAWTISLLLRRAFQGLPDARLLLGPVLLQQVVGIALTALLVEQQIGWSPIQLEWLNHSWQWPLPFTLSNAVDFSFLIAMLAILLYRFTRSRTHEERLSNEFEAARTVQQVLVPEAIPAIPGFKIETVYKPFSEVSGDFFQILHSKSSDGGNSAVVVIGDVSGKGMPAAMTVSLLVGTVRTLAHFTSGPGAILAAMNQRMLGRLHHGFTTCLVLRADADGTCTVASAGHPAPYRKGAEVTLETGLPLGLSESSSYPEVSFQLGEGESLTFITDGVVEARAKSGELFGFERAAEISTLPAEFIALTAQAFGQEDDITVLTLSRVAVGEPSVVEVAAPMLSPSPA
jgi:sigma-B regulation protein RsbU (phosphoserine phosphatase)